MTFYILCRCSTMKPQRQFGKSKWYDTVLIYHEQSSENGISNEEVAGFHMCRCARLLVRVLISKLVFPYYETKW